jgi:hypothetical protein
MPTPVDTRNPGLARASKRLAKSTAVTSNATTGVYTVAGGWLDDLQPTTANSAGDVIVLSALTGGSGVVAGQDYYLVGALFAASQATFSISATPEGAPLTGGTNITAGTVTTGRLTNAADGVLAGNVISAESVRGR